MSEEQKITYKDEIIAANRNLATDPAVCFVGYGVRFGGRAGGTLREIPEEQLIETPVAENLMASMAVGLALTGRKPVVYIERCDFLLNALDAIINHLDKAKKISRGEFAPAAIIRVVVGNQNKPLYTGPTHCQDFSDGVSLMLTNTMVRNLFANNTDRIGECYLLAYRQLSEGISTIIFEYKDLL